MRAIGPNLSTPVLIALLGLGLVAAPTDAWSPAPPTDLSVAPDGDRVVLSWTAPEGQEPDAFRVYLDGRLAAVVEATTATVHEASAYAVTAVYGDTESVPAVQADSPILGETWCDPLPITINTTNPPFIFPKPQLDCFNWVFDEVDELLDKAPPVPILIEVEKGIWK